MKATIRVKNERLSLVSFPAVDSGRMVHLHRGKSADVEVVLNEDGNILQPENLQDKLERGELVLTDSSALEKVTERKRHPEPVTEPSEDKPASKATRTAKKATAVEPAAEQPSEDGDVKNPLSDLPKIV